MDSKTFKYMETRCNRYAKLKKQKEETEEIIKKIEITHADAKSLYFDTCNSYVPADCKKEVTEMYISILKKYLLKIEKDMEEI